MGAKERRENLESRLVTQVILPSSVMDQRNVASSSMSLAMRRSIGLGPGHRCSVFLSLRELTPTTSSAESGREQEGA